PFDSTLKGSRTVPIKFLLTDVNGVRISDALAGQLLSGGFPDCKVWIFAVGVQTLPATCVRYDSASHQFIYKLEARQDARRVRDDLDRRHLSTHRRHHVRVGHDQVAASLVKRSLSRRVSVPALSDDIFGAVLNCLSRRRRDVIASIVRFRSGLTDEQVQDLYEARVDRYQQVPGLVEKLYLRYRSGEHGAIYVWENGEALEAFRASDLGRSIGITYKVEGEPETELADVTLRVESQAVSA